MSNGIFKLPEFKNEPVLEYRTGSKERQNVKEALALLRKEIADIPMYIGGNEVRTNKKVKILPPFDIKSSLGYYYRGTWNEVQGAINAALEAKAGWESMSWESRAAIFLRAAELIAGKYRALMNATTMLCQAKTVFQAEIDCVCEFVDFLRFNVKYMQEIYSIQPESNAGMWNRLEYRALEGFVFAITPFNFTSIAGNLPCAPALMGNTIVWKPANSQIYSAALIMKILIESGLPAGVINLVYCDGKEAGDVVFAHSDFAGLHFTGSTGLFQQLWKTIGNNISNYKSYPRIVGETGGKDFVVAHKTADAETVAVGLARGAFEYQGQKCSAASRAYISESIYNEVIKKLIADVKTMKMGSPEDFRNFVSAVIDEKAFDKIVSYIELAKKSKDCKILVGGKYDKSKGYFIEPTVIETTNPNHRCICEEIFGPVLTIYKFADKDWHKTLEIINKSSNYALTGAVFANDRNAIIEANNALKNAAGNFYINDKPTGAVVNQQPFGGARGSGTNDKAGSLLNLLRWVNARTIKETFVPPTNYTYPFMESE